MSRTTRHLVVAIACLVLGGCTTSSLTGSAATRPATADSIIAAMSGGLVGGELGSNLGSRDRRRALEAEYRALEHTAAGAPVAITYLSTEPVVQANKELSGRADEIIDTRVVELLYALPEGEATLYGESFDVTLPAKSGTP